MVAHTLSSSFTHLSNNSMTEKVVPNPGRQDLGIKPTAKIVTVDLGRLRNDDQEEAGKLFKAVKKDGLFYLNLQDPHFVGILDAANDVFTLSRELFRLKEEEKMQYDIDELSELKLNG